MELTQRWCEGKERWQKRRDTVDVKTLDCAPIDRKIAKEFVKTHHYSGSYPACRERFGLFRSGELVGVCVFGVPASERVLDKWLAFGNSHACELSRFVLLDEAGYNSETWFLARALDALVRARPNFRAVLSFSDPMPRAALDGTVVTPGHVGTIYQASNAAHLGRTPRTTLYLDAQGRAISPRALQKVREGGWGSAYAEELLLSALARLTSDDVTRGEDELGAAWLKRILPYFRRVRHTGNFAYAFTLDKMRERAAVEALKGAHRERDDERLEKARAALKTLRAQRVTYESLPYPKKALDA